jgi:dienelactone hydrolase
VRYLNPDCFIQELAAIILFICENILAIVDSRPRCSRSVVLAQAGVSSGAFLDAWIGCSIRLVTMKVLNVVLCCFAGSLAFAQKPVTFTLPGKSDQVVQADLYGTGTSAVVLAHGGRFNKESWKKQAQILAQSGFLVLALRFRGDGPNPNGSPGSFGAGPDNAADVLAAVAYLHQIGATTVSAVGGSFGGDAVGDASANSEPGNIARIVLLASSGGDFPEKLNGRKLFILARSDRNADGLRLDQISRSYAKARQPKKLIILEGSAHAQFLFDTDQGPRLMKEILRFLSEK